MKRLYKMRNIVIKHKSVFKTLQNIYDEVFLRKQLTIFTKAFHHMFDIT